MQSLTRISCIHLQLSAFAFSAAAKGMESFVRITCIHLQSFIRISILRSCKEQGIIYAHYMHSSSVIHPHSYSPQLQKARNHFCTLHAFTFSHSSAFAFSAAVRSKESLVRITCIHLQSFIRIRILCSCKEQRVDLIKREIYDVTRKTRFMAKVLWKNLPTILPYDFQLGNAHLSYFLGTAKSFFFFRKCRAFVFTWIRL